MRIVYLLMTLLLLMVLAKDAFASHTKHVNQNVVLLMNNFEKKSICEQMCTANEERALDYFKKEVDDRVPLMANDTAYLMETTYESIDTHKYIVNRTRKCLNKCKEKGPYDEAPGQSN